MKKRKNDDMLIDFSDLPQSERWNACLTSLEKEYNLSFKSMCRLLKCSRSWANSFLKPHLHYIHLSNGVGKTANFLELANEALGRDYKETNWYSNLEFNTLIQEHICDATRQTILLPVEFLVQPDCMSFFKEHYQTTTELRNLCRRNPVMKQFYFNQRNDLMAKVCTNSGLFLWKNQASCYKRSCYVAYPIDLVNIDLSKLEAVHDRKDYGDTDEEIYRDLFNEGYCRLVLKIPNQDGEASNMIYYYLLDDGFDFSDSLEQIVVPYDLYVKKMEKI